MSTILVSGSLAYDRIMDFPGRFRDHFLPDKLHAINVSFAVDAVVESFGGTAGNIAYSLALLEEKPAVYATVGKDFERYASWLLRRGVDIKLVRIVEKETTAAAYIMNDKEDNQITAFHFGAGATSCGNTITTASPDLVIVSAGNVVDMIDVPAQCRKEHVKFFCDTGQQITALSAEQLREHMEGAEILFGNDYEIELVKRKTNLSADDLLKSVKVIVVTRGAEGSSVITPKGELTVKATSAEALDPTGAGDSYRAGFAKGYLAGLPLNVCAQLAGAVAAFAVEKEGTQNHAFTMDQLKKRYSVMYGTTLEI